MSYDIDFKVKVEGLENRYVSVGDCRANVSWNFKEMIKQSTGLEWKNASNNGLCKDVIPYITIGLTELMNHPEIYKQYEPKNCYGTIEDCKAFFRSILNDWHKFCKDEWEKDLVDVAYFWIE